MKIYVKYMVSQRCKLVVKEELTNLGLHFGTVNLGEIEVTEKMTPEEVKKLKSALKKTGLELMDDEKSILIEKIKTVVIEHVHYSEKDLKIKFSYFLAEKLDYDYTYLANLFSQVMGTTIEQFMIAHKIEKVKELLLYDELSLTEISYKMQYSSVSHLSYQFKKVTGLTPSFFKNLKQHRRRILLEDIGEES